MLALGLSILLAATQEQITTLITTNQVCLKRPEAQIIHITTFGPPKATHKHGSIVGSF